MSGAILPLPILPLYFRAPVKIWQVTSKYWVNIAKGANNTYSSDMFLPVSTVITAASLQDQHYRESNKKLQCISSKQKTVQDASDPENNTERKNYHNYGVYCVNRKICLQHVLIQVHYFQVIHISKITKKSYCVLNGLNLNELSYFTNNYFILKGNQGVYVGCVVDSVDTR